MIQVLWPQPISLVPTLTTSWKQRPYKWSKGFGCCWHSQHSTLIIPIPRVTTTWQSGDSYHTSWLHDNELMLPVMSTCQSGMGMGQPWWREGAAQAPSQRTSPAGRIRLNLSLFQTMRSHPLAGVSTGLEHQVHINWYLWKPDTVLIVHCAAIHIWYLVLFQAYHHQHQFPAPPRAPLYLDLTQILNAASPLSMQAKLGMVAPLLMGIPPPGA